MEGTQSIYLRIGKLLGLIAVAIWATYFAPKFVASAIYIMALVAYFNSKDEAFWLTFFLVVSDGFFGFFNNYEAVISVIPGLPPIEVGHFYIILTAVKLMKGGSKERPFYDSILGILFVYVIFLVVQGYVLGVEPGLNSHFRILKFLMPLLLFYTIPRLFDTEEKYREAFTFFIPFAFLALFAQIFTVTMGIAPSQALGVQNELWFTAVLKSGHTYRGFYSTTMVLISFFGALYYTAARTKHFNKNLLYAVIAADFLSAFLSATRGWVLCFSSVLILHMIFVMRLDPKRITTIVVVGVLAMVGLMNIPLIEKQFSSAAERILTLGALAKGDVTAGGTLERLDERAPRVVKKWQESPLTGWGFSDAFHDYGDFHVGNQNVLLHSGIFGALLLLIFLGYFFGKLISRNGELPYEHPLKNALLVFPVFFLGWFIIHSTSGQQFQFYAAPAGGMAQAIFFSFGAMIYRKTFAQA